MGDMADMLNDQLERGQSILRHKETGEYVVEDNISLMYSRSWEKDYELVDDYTEERLAELQGVDQ